jgi:hypothetical protein
VTVTEPEGAGWLQVVPMHTCETPTTSNLNFTAGQTVANSVLATIPSAADCIRPVSGEIRVRSSHPTHVIVDQYGYFTTAEHAFPGG